ncbi:MAG: SRPBCC domain-containing protein [Polyangiales bacterium]
MIRYETETTIDAPPAEVWQQLVDVDRHDEWSRHFKLRGRPVVGDRGRVEFSLLGRVARVPIVIERVDEARELRWRGGPTGLVTGSHFFVLEPRDGGRRTRFVHGEDFSGLLAPLVWALLKAQLGPSYAGFNEDLKRRAEGR